MPRSMSAGAQNIMENFLSSSSYKSALYDEDMNLVWSNYRDFFGNFDLKQLKSDYQLTSEITLSVIVDGARAALNIIPVHRSLRVVYAYVCIIKEAYDIYNLMSKTIISDFSNNLIENNRSKTEKLDYLNRQINEISIELRENTVDDELLDRLNRLVQEQDSLIISMFDEAKFCMNTCFCDLPESKELCNLTLMFASVFSHIEEDFKELKRKVNVSLIEKDYYISKSGEMLLLAFLHLFRAHLTLSPLKGTISLSAEYSNEASNGGFFVIKLKTTILPKDKIDENKLVASRTYRELVKKVVMFNYDGTFNCADNKRSMQTVISIPVTGKRRTVLHSRGLPYNKENDIYHNYMREMLRLEAKELAALSDK